MQKKRPIVEMLRRYWMFPYHGSGMSVSPPSTEEEGGREREWFMIWVEDQERIRLKQQNAKTTKKTKLPCMKSAPA